MDERRWNDWRWQARNCIRDLDALARVLRLTDDERRGVAATRATFRLSIPPYYAALMDPDDPACPVRRQAVPSAAEAVLAPTDLRDPLGEDARMPVPGLVHRYPDRVLLLANNMCAVYCRFCTRKRLTGADNEALSRAQVERVVAYLRATPRVREVILSGGDPLVASDARLDEILGALRAVPSIEVLRVHTRMPVVMPMRVTDALCDALARHHPVWLNTHFNHPKELTPEAARACARLADAGVPVGNQTVLLRGVNDDARVLETLFRGLVRARVRPYYLHQCDPVEGADHFRTPVRAGVEILRALQGRVSGLAVPRFVVDAPTGGGKVPIDPDYVVTWDERRVVVRTYEGRDYAYPEARADAGSPVNNPG